MGFQVPEEERRSGVTLSHDQLEAVGRYVLEHLDLEEIAQRAADLSDNSRYLAIGKLAVKLFILAVGAVVAALVLRPNVILALEGLAKALGL